MRVWGSWPASNSFLGSLCMLQTGLPSNLGAEPKPDRQEALQLGRRAGKQAAVSKPILRAG